MVTADASGVNVFFCPGASTDQCREMKSLDKTLKKTILTPALLNVMASVKLKFAISLLSFLSLHVASASCFFFFLSQVVLTSMELLKNMAVGGGSSSLQSVELQMSLEEMMEMY